MDWRAKIKTQPYLFHLEVPHIKAGETASAAEDRERDGGDGGGGDGGGKKGDGNKKTAAIEAAEIVRKYRRESLGIVMPDDAMAAAVSGEKSSKGGASPSDGDQESTPMGAKVGSRISLTYADLVKTALIDLFQKGRISVPVWCDDTSHTFGQGGILFAGPQGHDVSMGEKSSGDGADFSNASSNATSSSNSAGSKASSSTSTTTFVQHSIVTFTSEYPELVKQRLAINIGLGTKVGCLNMLPITISKRADNNYAGEVDNDNMGGGNEVGDPNQHSGDGDDGRNHKEIAEGGFFASIQARLVVEQVVEGVRGAATFSFDYLCLVIVASMLAAVGLASNNTVVIVASMLVSPIMGPILAITFGTMIENNELVHMGLVNEVVSLVICILVGFVTAWIFIACDAHNEWIWPTNEMGGRGTSVGILTGIAIATPSGVGVALSILSNNTSSLVGVAISASLLPPAVNAGMMWAYAIFCAFSDSHVEYMDSKHYVGLLTNETSARVSAIPMNSSEISWAGLISLLLTLLNIAIILVTACAMFYFKSVVKYEGEGAEWSNEFKKYKAANYVVKNDGKGRLFAEKAKWVAKLGGGHAKGVKNSQFSAPSGRRSCSTCCQGSGVQDPSPGASLQMTGNPGGSGKKKHVTGRRISMPLGNPGMTGIGPGFGAQGQPHAHNNLTPKTGARPDALSLFGAPTINFTSSPAEKPADVHAQALAAGVVEGHKTLNRLMSQSILNRSGDPSTTGGRPGGLRSASSMVMSPSHTMGGSRTPIAMRPEQITLNHINTPKSLFKGRRARHAEQKVALSQTMATVHAMRRSSGAHTRAISHSQYGNMAMAGFFDAPDDSRFEA